MPHLLSKHLAHGMVRLARATPIGGKAVAPVIGLSIEIGETAGGKKGTADVADAPFDAAFLIATGDRDGTRLIPVVSGKAQQRGMEADRVAASFQHGAFQIVVEQHARHAVPGGERTDVAAQEVLHPGIEIEAQKDLARVAEHHDERHQRTARTADLQRTEMPPVHLTLFTWQAAQAQECFRRAAGAMLGNQMAEMVGAAAIVALVRHGEQAAGGQRGELLQRLADQRQIGVDR